METAARRPGEAARAGAGPVAPPAPGQARVVVVHSPKGGAGSSSVAVHLAAAWARRRSAVALVDLAPYGASPVLCKTQQRHRGLEAMVAAMEQGHLDLDGPGAPGATLQPFLTPLPAGPGRLDLLAGGGPRSADRMQPAQVRALLRCLRGCGYRQIVVDTSAEPTARNLAALLSADQILLVAVPDYTCCWHLLQLREMLGVLAPPASPVVALNRAHPRAGLTAAELGVRLGLPVIASLPEDPSVQRVGNHGVPWDLPGDSPFAAGVRQLAGALERLAAGAPEQQVEVADHG